jgi:release factor glutamine methyltransferase
MLTAIGVTVREELEAAVATLAAAGVDTARVDAEWLLADALGTPRLALRLEGDRVLSGPIRGRYRAAIARRARREPLQRVLGWEEFRGLRFRVTPEVLVPRPETEMLVGSVLELLPEPAAGRRLRVVDVGTGSGCIAWAIARERPDALVLALDVSLGAARVAVENARGLGLRDRVGVAAGDLLEAIGDGALDLIVANPPYLPIGLLPGLAPEVRDHEPRLALDGGPDGLAVIRRLIAGARRPLAPGGTLILESAGGEQAAAVRALLRQAGFVEIATRRDLAGIDRFVVGVRAAGRSTAEASGEMIEDRRGAV